MADDDDFDDQPTPPERARTSRPKLTDSERAKHRRTWVRGVPVVRPDPDGEVTAPLELLLNGQLDVDDYAQVEALRRSSDDVYVLLMNLARAFSRHREKDRSGSKEIERQVVAATAEQLKQSAALAQRVTDLEQVESRIAAVETTIKSVKGHGWKAATAIVVTLVGSAGAIVATLQSKAEKQGAADERSSNHGTRLDRLERIIDERNSAPAPTHHRDYDYDNAPAIVPPRHQKKDQEP